MVCSSCRQEQDFLARAKAVVAPAATYFESTMEGKRGGQLARMKAARTEAEERMGARLLPHDLGDAHGEVWRRARCPAPSL